MKREEVEKAILKKMQEINEIYKEYGSDGYLTMTIFPDYLAVNNSYFEAQEGHKDICASWHGRTDMDVEKFSFYSVGNMTFFTEEEE